LSHSTFLALNADTPVSKEQEGCKIKNSKLAIIGLGYVGFPFKKYALTSPDPWNSDPWNSIVQADVVTFLVAHKEFNDLDVNTDLDFCGVLK